MSRQLRARLVNGEVEVQYAHVFATISESHLTLDEIQSFFSVLLSDGTDAALHAYTEDGQDYISEFYCWRPHKPTEAELVLAQLALDPQ